MVQPRRNETAHSGVPSGCCVAPDPGGAPSAGTESRMGQALAVHDDPSFVDPAHLPQSDPSTNSSVVCARALTDPRVHHIITTAGRAHAREAGALR